MVSCWFSVNMKFIKILEIPPLTPYCPEIIKVILVLFSK